MSVSLVKLADFGVGSTGLSTVGYTIFNSAGGVQTSRTTTGVYELTAGSGIYAAVVSFPENFQGSILWDNGQTNILYAAEQYNYLENNPNVDKDLQNTNLILSGTIITSGTVVAGSDVFNIRTNILAVPGFYVGYVVRVTDAVSGSVDRPTDQYLTSSLTGTFVVDPAMPFIPTSGSQIFVLTQFSEMYGSVG